MLLAAVAARREARQRAERSGVVLFEQFVEWRQLFGFEVFPLLQYPVKRFACFIEGLPLLLGGSKVGAIHLADQVRQHAVEKRKAGDSRSTGPESKFAAFKRGGLGIEGGGRSRHRVSGLAFCQLLQT